MSIERLKKQNIHTLEVGSHMVCQLVYSDEQKKGYTATMVVGTVLSVEKNDHGLIITVTETDTYSGTMSQIVIPKESLEKPKDEFDYQVFQNVSVVRGLDWLKPSGYNEFEADVWQFRYC